MHTGSYLEEIFHILNKSITYSLFWSVKGKLFERVSNVVGIQGIKPRHIL